MTRKTRLWIGVTLFAVLVANYAFIGVPLFKKALSIDSRYKATMIRQLKSANSEEEYLLDIFRRERSVVARNILVLNTVSLSFLIIIGSWTAFGLIFRKGK